jgi:hydroxyacylglutathione hydrolase
MWTFRGHESKIIDTPGHTIGHIAFHFKSENALFTGDTLFSLGCGRLFEGTPEMMWNSICKLKLLPDETKIYCGHEYTESNAEFLNSIYVNDLIIEKIKQLKQLRKDNIPSIPTILSEEKKLNIFLQADNQEIKNILNMSTSSDEAVFTKLRSLKDNF